MKSVAITCILAGILTFSAPMFYQFGCFALVAYSLANTHLPSMNISAPALENGYRLGSIGLGLILTVVGVVFGFRGGRTPAVINPPGSVAPPSTPQG